MPMKTPVIPLTNMSTVVANVLLRFAWCRLEGLNGAYHPVMG